jgi:predicted TIM-barrel fold metal-dependent hydrolase
VKQLIEAYVSDFSQADKEKILGGNAALFYGLKSAKYGLGA